MVSRYTGREMLSYILGLITVSIRMAETMLAPIHMNCFPLLPVRSKMDSVPEEWMEAYMFIQPIKMSTI